MSREGAVTDGGLYARAKAFFESITKGDVVVKHQDDEPLQRATKYRFISQGGLVSGRRAAHPLR